MSRPPHSPSPPATPSPVTRDTEGKAPTCPRCGYDLSVSTQMWPEGACPVGGTCNECGLGFRWSEVLAAQRPPGWLVEYRPFHPLAWVRGVLAPLAPWGAIGALPLALPRRCNALALLPVAMAVLLYLLIGVLTQAWRLAPSYALSGWNAHRLNALEGIAWPFQHHAIPRLPVSHGEVFSPLMYMVLFHALVMPLTFLTLDTTLGKANIRMSHLLRLGVVLILPVCGVAAALMVLRVGADVLAGHGHVSSGGVLPDTFPAWLDPTVPPHEDASVVIRDFVLYSVWSIFAWWMACRRYLRLRWALFHVLVLEFMALLFCLASIVGVWKMLGFNP